MQFSVIDSLFYGGISAFSRHIIPTDERKRLNQKIEEERHYFMKNMSIEDYKRFDNLDSLYSNSNSFQECDSFSYGMRLGVMLMCEIFLSEEYSGRENE